MRCFPLPGAPGIVIALFCLFGPATGALAAPAQYDSPQEALDAFIAALVETDTDALDRVFGPEAHDLVAPASPAENAANRAAILKLYRQGYRFQPTETGGVTLLLGADGWPFPLPLVREQVGWHFDSALGREEMRDREIGGNEIDVIALMEAYVRIQADYRRADHDGDGVAEFASHILSSGEGLRDGLFWIGPDSPMGNRLARAALDGYSDGTNDYPPDPFLGYYFRVLQAQSENAPGGALDYVINGNQIAGHALLAVPALYGETGLHTFMVSENGPVLQADLGEETLAHVEELTSYDPDGTWSAID